MTLSASLNAISSPEAVSGPSQLELLDGLIMNPSGPQAAPVSRSRRQAKEPEPMIQGICGRTYIGSSVPEGPLSRWESRLRERLAMVGSTESALIWRLKVSPQGQSISRLAVSTRHTNGTGNTGPQSTWSTPRATDGEKGGPNMSFGAGGQPLPAQMHQNGDYWRAPTAGEKRGGSYSDPEKAKARIASGHTVNLEDQVVAYGMEPTGPTPNGSNAPTEKRGAPNPIFAFWLMGFPDAWISGALAAMQLYRKPRRK